MPRKKDPQEHVGNAHYAQSDPRYKQAGPVKRGTSRREGTPIPTANDGWHPQARSWFNSLRISGQSEFYEPSDWATAVAAAGFLDIFLKTHNASVGTQFVKLSERLGATFVDRAHARIMLDDPEPSDDDEDAADNVVRGWQSRLIAKHHTKD